MDLPTIIELGIIITLTIILLVMFVRFMILHRQYMKTNAANLASLPPPLQPRLR